MRDPEEVFYNDCPPHIAAWASARLEHESLISWRQPLRPAAWRGIPSIYIVCTKDAASLRSLPERMASRAGEALFLDSSRSPFLSQPDTVANLPRVALQRASTTAGDQR